MKGTPITIIKNVASKLKVGLGILKISHWQVLLLLQISVAPKILCAQYTVLSAQCSPLSTSMAITLTLVFRIGIKLQMVPNASHHIYADQAEFFNNVVNKTLNS